MRRGLKYTLGLSAVLLAAGFNAAHSAGALATAVRKGSNDTIMRLMATGQSINELDDQGQSPLYYACLRGDTALIKQLVTKGADLNARAKNSDTPLIALVRNTVDVTASATFLEQHGADLNAQNEAGQTALMVAVLRSPDVLDFRSETALVKGLLAAGADPNLKDVSGSLALHHAATVGQPLSMFRAVLAATREPRIANSAGLDVLALAVQNNHTALIQQLFQAGYTPIQAPPMSAARVALAPIKVDDHYRVNGYGFALYGDYLKEQGHPEEAINAYHQGADFLDRAVTEIDRAFGATADQLAKDQRGRNNARVATLLASAAGIALAATTGYGAIFAVDLAGTVEGDKAIMTALQADKATIMQKRDELRRK